MKFVQTIFLLYVQGLLTNHTHSIEVTAVEGRIAVLDCPASSELSPSSKPTLLRWFHSGHHKPIYTLDVRKIDGWTGAKHFPSSDFDGRLYLEVLTTPLALRVDPVKYEDSGRFMCRIDFRGERSVRSTVDLKVVVPPKTVIIREGNGKQVQSIVGPFTLGEEVILACESSGGKPMPKLKWSSSISDSNFEVKSQDNTSTIIIPHLTRHHQWSHFTCTATNSPLIVAKSSTVTIELNLPPIEVDILSEVKGPFKVGQTVSLTCKSVGSHPRAHLRWYNQGDILSSEEIIDNNGNTTISYLKRKVGRKDNGKSFDCIATNPNLPKYVKKKSYYMQVLYPPDIEINLLGSPIDWVTAGSNVTLQCTTDASPNACKIVWIFNDEEIRNSSSTQIDDNCLKMHNIKRSQTGTYICQAENTLGISSSSVYINVLYPPVCHRLEITSRDSEIANVTCSLQSNPPDVTYRWTALNSSSFNHSWASGRGAWAEVPWGSKVLCWGENDVGRQKEPCVLGLGGKQRKVFDKESLIIAGSAVLFCIIGILIVGKRYHANSKSKSYVGQEQTKSFKDRGCGHVINNCVKATNNITETECLTTLLNSKQKTDQELSENLQRSYGFSTINNNTQPRRIRSTQF